ncbi:hypothetical protein [uncultured Rummeliibacillus sp.]|uniref:hypothetical protein n=1 Tax=uncultured Rummeliibacillus sp. TaxID=762292 RepID=UPI00261C7471|nr:hypothetical protein [uncultured Rummeliibacillus sp.]
MITQKGTVSKIKVLKLDKSPLVRFSLDETSCLIRVHSLNFMWEVDEGSEVVVGGQFNSRKQFVVRKYCVMKKDLSVC